LSSKRLLSPVPNSPWTSVIQSKFGHRAGVADAGREGLVVDVTAAQRRPTAAAVEVTGVQYPVGDPPVQADAEAGVARSDLVVARGELREGVEGQGAADSLRSEQPELGAHAHVADAVAVVEPEEHVVLVIVEVLVGNHDAQLPTVGDAVSDAGAETVPVQAQLTIVVEAERRFEVDDPIPVVVIKTKRPPAPGQCIAGQQAEQPRFLRDAGGVRLLARHRHRGREAQQRDDA